MLANRPRLADSVTAASAGGGEWAEVISQLQPAIVALKVTAVRSFEEDPASTALGTGFVVDKERGIILTNRHITGVGPVRATATFDRHEELEAKVLYRDPIHDFGFMQYDPARLRLTRCAEIVLDPKGLQVGAEVRVIGNDAGEKLQILSGTIARVDRNAPEFNTVYNDENTFYAGAGAGTSGGSSGSPVLNKEGRAIALNAAGQEGAASAYFLPLDRVQYAFGLLQQGKEVPRGTCNAGFLFKPFDELTRVGLHMGHEQDIRSAVADATGLLIVDTLLCEQQILKTGDILLRLENQVCTSFVEFECLLDARVGRTATMRLCRGGEEITVEVDICDLHALIPRSFVELGFDTLHAIGYHAARRTHLPLDTGLYLAKVGFVFDSLGCGRAAVITHIGTTHVSTAEALVEALADISHRQYFQVSWYELQDFRRDRTLKTGFAKMARMWFPLRLWRCHPGAIGGQCERWEARDFAMPPIARPCVPPIVGPANFPGGNPLVRRLSSSLVTVRFRTDRRFVTQASPSGVAEGTGLLVDAEHGLVLTDRHSVPQSLGDIEVTLGGGLAAVDGEVLFVHPLHNLVIIRCDPAAFKDLRTAKVPLQAAKLAKGDKASLLPGESVNFIGYDNQGNVFSTKVTIAACYLPSGRDEFPLWEVPRFRERNLEIVVLADTPEDARGGVLCDSSGTVRALFAAFDMQDADPRTEATEAYGIAANYFAPLVERFRRSPEVPVQVCSLDAEVTAIDVATLARGAHGQLPQGWLQAVGQRCRRLGQVPRAMRVHRLMPLGASEERLRSGDVLLSVGGRAMTCCLDLEQALAEWHAGSEGSVASRASREPVRQLSRGGRGRGGSAGRVAGRGRGVSRGRGRGRSRSRSPPAAGRLPSKTGAGEQADLAIRVFRDGAEVEVSVKPAVLDSDEEDRLLLWAGLVLRRVPRCALERCSRAATQVLQAMLPKQGVFIQHVLGGSPSDTREIPRLCFLLEVNGHAVRDLEDVLSALAAAPAAGGPGGAKAPGEVAAPAAQAPGATASGDARPWIRMRLMDTHGQEHVKALQSDPLYFPTFDMTHAGPGRWECHRRDH